MPKHRVRKGDDGWGKKVRKVSCLYFQIRINCQLQRLVKWVFLEEEF